MAQINRQRRMNLQSRIVMPSQSNSASQFRVSRKGNLVPLNAAPRRPRRNRRSNFIRRTANTRNRNVPNTFRAMPSGTNSGNRRVQQRNDTQYISKRELWFSVIPGTNKYVFQAGNSGIPHLDRFASIYEQAQLRYFHIEYIPAAGTTNSGTITIGADYEPDNDRTPQGIPLLEPNSSGTIYTRHAIKPLISRIMKGNMWIPTAAAGKEHQNTRPFALYVKADTDSTHIGQIWVTYKIAFATATIPDGSITATPIPISVSSVDVTSDIAISQPNSTNVDSGDTADITTISPPQVTKVTDDGSTFETKIELKVDDWKVNDELTLGTNMVSSPSIASLRSSLLKSPTIHFEFPDGTPVPPGVIEPVNKIPRVVFRTTPSSNGVHNIFASLFKILKPIADPFLAVIEEVIAPILGEDAEESDLLSLPSEVYNVFGFKGDEAVITVPPLNGDSLSSHIPLHLVFYGGKGGSMTPKSGQTQIYSFQYYSYKDTWLHSVKLTGSGGEDTVPMITFADPVQNLTSGFHNGDLMVVTFNSIPMDKGIGVNEKTPWASPLTDDQVKTLVQSFSESSLSDQPEITSTTAPKLQLESFVNNSAGSSTEYNVGVFLNFRFVSPDDSKSYPYAVIKFLYRSMTDGVPYDALSNISHPDNDYTNVISHMTFQIFQTDKTDLQPERVKHTQFNLSKINIE